MAEEIKKGDLVRHKTGERKMLIVAIEQGIALCEWVNYDNQVFEGKFRYESLEKAPEVGPDFETDSSIPF